MEIEKYEEFLNIRLKKDLLHFNTQLHRVNINLSQA